MAGPWRKLDRAHGYPGDFVRTLTEAGCLAALIPEQYGGSGLPLAAAAWTARTRAGIRRPCV
jgi:acyl-CoA dehydrogenase